MLRKLRSIMVTGVLAGSLVVAPATLASAGKPDNPNCWGKVTAQRASTEHDLGAHSSSQSNPRMGLGNVARALSGPAGGDHVSNLGSFLATLDGLAQTSCP